MRTGFDHVIVGAGSAGCVLASRLTEDPATKVLLLEAGGWDRNPWLRLPLAWPRVLLRRMDDWMYFSQAEAALAGRAIECARGKVVGGSSSVNAMAWVRGPGVDFDRWAAGGLADWSFEKVLPAFRRLENWEGGADPWRGAHGPVRVEANRYADPLCEAFRAAGLAAGHAVTADYNGAQQEGFGLFQVTRRGGRRCSAADAWLRPALQRPNLTVLTGSMAHRVTFEGDRATGLVYARRGRLETVRAHREVLLAGGVINSPQLLMLSGIGDADHLAAHGIAVKVALPSVGRNLQDHLSVAVAYRRRTPGSLHRALRADRAALLLADGWLRGRGIAATLPVADMAFLRTRHATESPDVQLLFVAAPMTAAPWLPPFRPPYADGFTTRAVLLRPQSRGTIELASADPAQAPIIRQNFLTRAPDAEVLRDGLRMAMQIGRQAPLAGFVAAEIAPAGDDDATLDAHIRDTAITVHHPAGTCRMGGEGDHSRVVDAQLRVVGTRGLRVVDASVFPDLVGGNINATVMMVADKAAEMIRRG